MTQNSESDLNKTQKNSQINGDKILALSINSQDNGYAIWEDGGIVECGELDIEKDRYFKTLRSIFFTVMKFIRERNFTCVAIKQEVEDTHPGITSKNMRIIGLVMGASFISGRVRIIEVSQEAVLQASGLHTATRQDASQDLLKENIEAVINMKVDSFKMAEAVAVAIAANWQLNIIKQKNEKYRR